MNCRRCKTTFPTTRNIDEQLTQLNDRQEMRLTALENRMENTGLKINITIGEKMVIVRNEI